MDVKPATAKGTGKILMEGFYVACPECGGAVPSDYTGSFLWGVSDIQNGYQRPVGTCEDCGKVVRLPKRLHKK